MSFNLNKIQNIQVRMDVRIVFSRLDKYIKTIYIV